MRLIVGATANAVREKILAELSEIAERRARAYLLVPEQFTMQSDMQLLARLKVPVMMDIKVKSFGSLSREVLGRTGGIKLPYVNESGRRMLAQYLLGEHHQALAILGRGWDQSGVATKLLETLSEFRSLSMTAEDVAELEGKAEEAPLLAEKLADVRLLLAAYEEALGEQRLDNESRLSLLAEKVHEADWLDGLPMYLDGFHSLSQPELAVLQALEARGAALTMGLVMPPEMLTEQQGWWTMHSACQASLRFYETLCKAGLPLQVEAVDATGTMLADVVPLAQHLFGYETPACEGGAAVEIWKAPQAQTEITYLAGVIRRMVAEEGLRWRDFHVTTNQPQVYFPLIERIFKQYEIPAFIDERKALDVHYLVRYLLTALDMVEHHFAYPMVFACLQTGLAGLSEEEIVALDYYARVKHLRGTMYFDARYFQLPDDNVVSRKMDGLRARQETAARAQQAFTARFKPLYEDVQAARTVRDFSTIVYHFLTAPELLDAFHAEDAAKAPTQLETDDQIVEALVALLDQLVATIGEMEVSLEQYSRILSEGLSEASLGIVPPAQDEVQVVELGRARTGRCKVQVVVGMSDAWLPSQSVSRTIFIREEKRWLEKAGVSLRYDEGRILEDEALCLYEAMGKPTERLIFSYPLSGSDGAVMNESVLITRAKQILPSLQKREKSLLADFNEVLPYLEWESLKVAADWLRRYAAVPELAEKDPQGVRWAASVTRYFEQARPNLAPFLQDGLYYTNLRAKLEPEVVKKLYPALSEGRVSISELESWQGCPYKHFLRYGIRPEEELDYTLRSDELGTVLHGSLDRLTRDLRQHPEWLDWDDAAICAQMDAYLSEEEQLQLDGQRSGEARNASVLEKVRRQGHKAGRFIIRQLRESDFSPRFNEVSFGENAPILPPIYLDMGGQILRIEGRIDRIDTWRQGDKVYARVIDYKSGFNSFDIARVWAGLDLQLMLYLRAALGWRQEPLPAGVFYLSLKKPFMDTTSLDEKEIESLFVNDLLMDGVFIDDPQVIAALDRGTREGTNQVIAFRGRGKTADNCISADLLERLLAHTVKAAQDTVRAVMEGDIRVLPLDESQKGGCEYCNFMSVCRFENNRSGNRTRSISKVDWNEVKKNLAKEEEA